MAHDRSLMESVLAHVEHLEDEHRHSLARAVSDLEHLRTTVKQLQTTIRELQDSLAHQIGGLRPLNFLQLGAALRDCNW